MTLNEFLFDSVESFEHIYVDYGESTKESKELTPILYDLLENCEVLQWHLDIKQHKPCIIIKVEY